MPTRVLREGILTSERVNALSPEGELFYRRLMSIADDFGRHLANPTLLRSAAYPLKPDLYNEAQISRFLAECSRTGLIRVYEVKGRRYLEMLDFRQRTRAKTSKCPPPDGHEDIGAHGWHSADTCPSDVSHARAETETETETNEHICASGDARLLDSPPDLSVDAPPFDTTEPGALFPADPPEGGRTNMAARAEQEARRLFNLQQDAWFEEWWAAYWLKKSRKRAREAFRKHVRSEARFRRVMEATAAQAPEML